MSILFAKDLPCRIISSHKDNDGRILLVNIEINKVEYSICNVYCPNDVSDRIAFLHYVKQFVKCHATSTANTLIGGDFNCVDDPMDKASRSTDKSSIEFTNLKTLDRNATHRYNNAHCVLPRSQLGKDAVHYV